MRHFAFPPEPGHDRKKQGNASIEPRAPAKGTEMLDRLGVIQAVDFSGCGGPQSPKSTRLTFEVDIV